MNGAKSRIYFKKSPYGKFWQQQSGAFYDLIFSQRHLVHENFINFLQSKNDVSSVLEIGCGTGIYPIRFKELFSNAEYTGIDIGEPAIEYCRNNSSFKFICGDFLKMELNNKYDLTFSHSVIDCIYDIDLFLSRLVKATKKYSYISSYYGYFPNQKRHVKTWIDASSCYHNFLSAKELEKCLIREGLSSDEFVIRPQRSSESDSKVFGERGPENVETVIEINRRRVGRATDF